jgi:O-antigen/teichoic acid export membrane protein
VDLNIQNRLVKGFSANIYNQVISSIIQLAGVPIFLYAWGAELYGEWLIIFAIPAYLSMTDLGFSQSASNDMTARVARGERSTAIAIFQSLIAFVYTSMGCMFALISFLIFALPIGSWIRPIGMNLPEVRWTLWFLSISVLAQLPDGITHAGFRSNGEYALHSALYGSARLIQFASSWIVALCGGSPVAAAAVFCLVRAMATAVCTLMLIYRHPWLRYGTKLASKRELSILIHPALANMAIPLAQGLNIQGMVLAVGNILGPLAVVTFSTLRTLTRLVLQLLFSISHAAEPELASAFGRGDYLLCRNLFLQSLRAGLWLGLLSAAGLAMFGNSILAIWTHKQVVMNSLLFAWLLASALAGMLWYGGLIVLKAANMHLRASLLYAASSGIALVIGVLMMIWSGTVAEAGLALLLMDAIMTAYTLRAASRLMGTRALQNLLESINPSDLLRFSALIISRAVGRK